MTMGISMMTMATNCKKINKNTHPKVDEPLDGLDDGPCPLSVGHWVDGTSIVPANGDTSRALLGVDLQKIKAPRQLLGATVVGEVLTLEDELPNKLNDPHAHSEELAEEPCLRRPRTNAMFRSVLYVSREEFIHLRQS